MALFPARKSVVEADATTTRLPLSLSAVAQREGEDAQVTGMTRSLHRRLLALNMKGVSKIKAQSVTIDTVDTVTDAVTAIEQRIA